MRLFLEEKVRFFRPPDYSYCENALSRWRLLPRVFRLQALTRVYQVTQLLAGLEVGDTLGRNLDLGAGLWVPPHPRVSLSDSKAAEAANLDLVS
jgi:hypothetical protein